ncbi:MAG TPA: HAD-IA family hydrolase [Vicinamibacterales bacterium]|nr:HAD-IA family hydrolase [Vicinamibacterales bacterium]
MTPRLIAFDLDGTLVDSRRDLADSVNAMLAGFGAAPLPDALVGAMVGDGAAMLVRRALGAAGLSAVGHGDALARFLAEYDRRLLAHTRPYDGIVALLEALGAGRRLAVLTNKPGNATRAILRGLELDRFFDAVISGDGPLPRKPDPGGLLALARRAGVTPAETMLVGDSAIDLETARRAGTRVCVARWGFGYPPGGLALREGELAADSPAALRAMLGA